MMSKSDDIGQKLFTRMRLWELEEQYLVEPADGSSGHVLEISRQNGSIQVLDDMPRSGTLCSAKTWTIFGIAGMIKMLAGSYLFVITERGCVGSYSGRPLFKIVSMKVFPCDNSIKKSPRGQKRIQREFSHLIRVAERTPGLYFSYDANITLSTQRLHDMGHESKLLSLWKQADPQFLWNNYMLEMLVDYKLYPYLLPIMQGSFQSFRETLGENILDITLMARRCTRRTGTRMWRRGADSDGYVANFVETEQIIQYNGHTASFIQVRGSIPLFWDQIVDLTYNPKFDIIRLDDVSQVVDRHFLHLSRKYGTILAVDLVNKRGGEGCLCETFGNAMQQVSSGDVRYLHFDFHRICGHVDFERLSILYHRIETFFYKNRYLLLNDKGEKIDQQIGVVRTNSVDCLDRTNVTQSTIARRIFECQLRRLGVLGSGETITMYPNVDETFKILWTKHGDDVSFQYSGTSALKGDFVRYGQRTLKGILKDGFNVLLRYYLSNFSDGRKQDAIDLIHGHYTFSKSQSMTPKSREGGLETLALFPLAFSVVMAGLFFATSSLKRVGQDLRNLFSASVWVGISFGVASFVKANGRIFCNRPRLS